MEVDKLLKSMECSIEPYNSKKCNCKECEYRLLEEVDDKFPCPPDVEEGGKKYWESCDCDRIVQDAISTIRELQEKLEGSCPSSCPLLECNAVCEDDCKCEYKWSDGGCGSECQYEQNKWHLCNEEFPKESGYYLVAYHEWSNGDFLPKYDDTRVRTMHFQNSEQYVGWNYPVCCDERAENDTYREVIAWMELPKFDNVEQK